MSVQSKSKYCVFKPQMAPPPQVNFYESINLHMSSSPYLLDCQKPLMAGLFSGKQSGYSAASRYFRQVTMDILPKYNPTWPVNVSDWDYKRSYDKLLVSGCGPIRFVLITSPCNSWSLMCQLPGRPPMSQSELGYRQSLVHTVVEILLFYQSRLHQIVGPDATLYVLWGNPSSAGDNSLAAYLLGQGILSIFPMSVQETSWCQYGMDWSKPSNVIDNIPYFRVLPPCRKFSEFGQCHKCKSHRDVTKMSTDESYILPEILLNEASYRAYRAIQSDNVKAGVSLSEDIRPRRLPKSYQPYPTPESFEYPNCQYVPYVDVPMQYELGMGQSGHPTVSSLPCQFAKHVGLCGSYRQPVASVLCRYAHKYQESGQSSCPAQSQ